MSTTQRATVKISERDIDVSISFRSGNRLYEEAYKTLEQVLNSRLKYR